MEEFCRAYIDGGRNATRAYKAAYKADRMSPGAIRTNASKLLKDPRIKARVDAATAAAERETEITVAWTLRRLKEEADRDDENASHAARVTALKAIGQHLGMFPRVHQHSGPGGLPIAHEHSEPVVTEDEIRDRLCRLFGDFEEQQAHEQVDQRGRDAEATGDDAGPARGTAGPPVAGGESGG
jgi:hypothetical protein